STRFTAEAGRTGAAESVQSAEAPPRASPAAANQGERSEPAGPDYAEEDDDRPWEQPGQIRRDAVSHRGHLVLTLGILGVVLSVLGIPALFCGFCCPPVGIVGSLISLPFTITAWAMGQSDLQKMRKNMRDPRGQGMTGAGWICGLVGTILGALATVVTTVWWIFILAASAANNAITPASPAPATKPVAPPTKEKQVSISERL